MDGGHATGLGHGDNFVDIQICPRIFSQMEQFLGPGGEGRGLVHVRGRDHGHGLKHFLDGPDNTSGGDATVGDKNLLAANLLGDVLKTARCLRHVSLRARYVYPGGWSSGVKEPQWSVRVPPAVCRTMPPSALTPACTPRTDDRLSPTRTMLPR